MACHETAECGDEFACLCGICTTACDDSAVCNGLGEGAGCYPVEGCGDVAGVCSTPDFEAARGNRSRDAGNVHADAGAVSVSNAGATADEGTVNSTSTGDVTPAVTVAEQLSSESSSAAEVNRSDLTEVDGTDTRCSPSAADAGACGSVAVCEAGQVLPTIEPCELTGFVTRDCVAGQWVDRCTSCQRVALADVALEQAIRAALEKPVGELTLTDAAKLTTLIANDNEITDLRGIECFTNLDFVDLSVNLITDVSPIGVLPVITNLGLTMNQVADITPLAASSTLENLWIAGNRISDLSPLSSLTKLKTLGLSSNSISDLAPLRELTTLTDVDVSYNTFTSIEPLGGLAGLRNLTVGPNPAFGGDLSPITNLAQLEMLFLPDCGLEDAELAALSSLTDLDYLDLTNNGIVDVGALSAYSNTTLTLNDNPIDCDSASLAALEAQNFMTYTDCP